MCLIQVNVISADTAQGSVDGLHHVLTTQAPIVSTAPRGPVHLRENFNTLATLPFERGSQHLFRLGSRIDIGRVEGGNPSVECRMDSRMRGGVIDLRSMGNPVAERYFTDFEAASA